VHSEPTDFTSLIYTKSKQAPPVFSGSKVAALYWAASELWTAEYQSWLALVSIFGPDHSAVRCAWQRRTAYARASSLLLRAW
jgi:hypothetical protein